MWLEMYFPSAFFDIMVHLLVHIVDDIIDLGPTFMHNMLAFERMNDLVRNRAHPDASVVQGDITEECILFCTNYLDVKDPIGLPANKHFGRLQEVGHITGWRELLVDHMRYFR